MTRIDGHIYVNGHRTAGPCNLEDAAEALKADNAVAWIGSRDPDPDTLDEAASRFGSHLLAIEDARKGHQRAKLERYGDTMFVVLRPGTYDDDDTERVEFGEIHLFVGSDFVLTLRRGDRPDLVATHQALERAPLGAATVVAEQWWFRLRAPEATLGRALSTALKAVGTTCSRVCSGPRSAPAAWSEKGVSVAPGHRASEHTVSPATCGERESSLESSAPELR